YPSLAVVELNEKGQPSTYVASEAQLADLAGDTKAAILSAAELVDPTGAQTRIVLGAPHHGMPQPGVDARGRIFYLDLADTAGGVELRLSRGPDPGTRSYYGLGVAAGQIGGGPAPDYVAVSLQDGSYIEDGNDA